MSRMTLPPGTSGRLGICQFGKYCKRRGCILAHPGGRVNGADDNNNKDEEGAPATVVDPPPPVVNRVIKKKPVFTAEQIREAELKEAAAREVELEKERKAEVEAERVREVIRARKIKKEQEDAERAAAAEEEEEEARRLRRQQELQREEERASAPAPVVAASSPSPPPATFREDVVPSADGLDPVWFEDQAAVEAVKCSVCLMVAHQPPSLPCGHVFCHKCLEALTVHERKCPECRKPIKLSACPPNVFVSRHIAALKMHCPHHADGCQTVLSPGPENRYLVQHEAECAHAAVVCNQCNTKVKRMDKASHQCAKKLSVEDDLRMRLADRDSRLVYQSAQVAAQQREIETLRAQLAKRQDALEAAEEALNKSQQLNISLQTQLQSARGKVCSLRNLVNQAFEEVEGEI